MSDACNCPPACPVHSGLQSFPRPEIPTSPEIERAAKERDVAQERYEKAHAEWSELEGARRRLEAEITAEQDGRPVSEAARQEAQERIEKPAKDAERAMHVMQERAQEAAEARERHRVVQHRETQRVIASW